jgi:hypothetical protein
MVRRLIEEHLSLGRNGVLAQPVYYSQWHSGKREIGESGVAERQRIATSSPSCRTEGIDIIQETSDQLVAAVPLKGSVVETSVWQLVKPDPLTGQRSTVGSDEIVQEVGL